MPVTSADRNQDRNMAARAQPGYNQPAPAPAPPAQSYGGGGGGSRGGGGGGAAMAQPAPPAPPAVPRVSLEDYIRGNFLYKNQEAENQRLLGDYDAQTMMGQQQTEADQTSRRTDLNRTMDEAGVANANEKAARGTLRSGFTFQDQEKINVQGTQQRKFIDDLLTNFIAQRGSGRVNEQAQGRNRSNSVMTSLTDQFNKTQNF
jgi:hypothetical protein